MKKVTIDKSLIEAAQSKGNISTCSAMPLLSEGKEELPNSDSADSSRSTITTTSSGFSSETSSLNDEVRFFHGEAAISMVQYGSPISGLFTIKFLNELRHEKTCLRGLRPDKTQTSLLSYRD